MPSRQGHVRMHWRGGCIAREGAHATPCCSVLALVRVRRAGCPARESVTACRGRSCRCGPAADRTPALQDGSTSLHEASLYGHAAVVQTLLQHGDFKADLDAGNAEGITALHWASQEGDLAVVQVLLKVGADVEAKNQVSLKRETWTHA